MGEVGYRDSGGAWLAEGEPLSAVAGRWGVG